MQGFKTTERTNVVVNANDKFSSGTLTLEVGGIEENVSVSGRVSELQARAASAPSRWRARRSRTSPTTGARSSASPASCPACSPRRPTAERARRVRHGCSRLHRQRPAAELQQHDDRRRLQHRHRQQRRQHGHHQHRRGGRVQDPHQRLPGRVRPRGGRPGAGRHQERHPVLPRLGYWYGRRSDWNANTWTNKRDAAPPPVGQSGRRRCPRPRATTTATRSAARSSSRASSTTEKKKLFFFWSQEFQRRQDPVAERQARVPTALERARRLLAERRQQRQPLPLHP